MPQVHVTVRKQPLIESENELKFYKLKARK